MDRSREQSVASSSKEDDATIKLGQGSILPRTSHDRLGLSALEANPDLVVLVISHDCDLVKPDEVEPFVELIHGRTIDKMNYGLAYTKSLRLLHIEYKQDGEEKVLELSALDKTRVDKKVLIGIEPDPDATLSPKGIETLRMWLAARYNRAAFPDDLDRRLEPIKRKLSAADQKAVTGTWMRYEPDSNHLPSNEPYELWVKIVYSTREYEAKAKAEHHANELRLSFEKQFRIGGEWHSIDLRACEAVPDTVFSVRDLNDYKQWRLEHLSLRQDPSGEYI